MTTMIERVARAMCAPFDPDEEIYLGSYKPRWRSFTEQARAAIEEMREPTDEMASKGADVYFSPMPQTVEDENRRASSTWRHMIDAALKDQP